MTWFGYLLLVWWAICGVGAVVLIGKPRHALTPEAGAILVVIYALFVWGVLAVGTNT